MTNKFFVSIITVVLIIIGTLYYFQLEKTSKLKEKISHLETASITLSNKSVKTKKLYDEHSEELQKKLIVATKQITELKEFIAGQSLSGTRKITKDSEGKAVTDYMSGLARMMEHSTLRDSTRVSIRENAVNVVYGDFIKEIMMDKEEAEIIMELLVDKSFARFGRRMEMLDPKLSCSRKKIIIKQIKEDRAAIDKKIQGMVSKEVFKKYLEFEKISKEILFVNAFKIKLSNKSIQMLTKRQQGSLIKLIYKERIFLEKQSGYISFEYACPEDLTDKNVRKFFQQEKTMDSKILRKSETILTKEQFTAFAAFLKHSNDELKRKVKLLRSVRNPKSKLAIC